MPATSAHAVRIPSPANTPTLPGALSAVLLAAFLASAQAAAAAPGPATARASAAKDPAAAAPAQPVVLRQQAIHIAYNEGDFDKVIAEIETFTKANRTYSRGDSIFIAKHLAVVHTANPATREKGKYYMYRLLEMVPSAELVDMFVSDEIDRIFDKVRKEFLARQRSFGVDSTRISLPERPAAREEPAVAAAPAEPAPSAPGKAGASGKAPTPFYKKRGFWMMTGAGLAAVGAVATYVHSQEEKTGKSIVIDK
jgi:hypothetical protein